MSSTSDAALKAEIERLTGAINRHKSGPPRPTNRNTNAYVNPAYKPPSRPVNSVASSSKSQHTVNGLKLREVMLDGVAFQSSTRSLVRKDLVPTLKPTQSRPTSSFKPHYNPYAKPYSENRGAHRPYKPKSKRRFPRGQNMTLTNSRKPRRGGKSMKLVDKQCSKFSTTGICSRGRTCPYRHDPEKIAICWAFLQGHCPNNAETCQLSHEPTPERAPLCVHFANNGRCKNGAACLFPHVHVGPRNGVCRDFAVLGYCAKGIDCDKHHVRECPDFAEKGTCPNNKCKLPHVIRASHRRVAAAANGGATKSNGSFSATNDDGLVSDTSSTEQQRPSNVNQSNIGDEYISLTFHESGESEEEEDDDDDEGSDEEDQDGDVDDGLEVVA
ncbi:hypothetical protein SCHPADRAFT_829126 [Schizopora paradoxa]|uniref:C3H1-type domain-containing protein n=1 Tax=Schizopora paradoxa TaxID=27342 RepID=A0A0H2RM76_9AGAM|nr:hypothetical protein SCHPADRAFT_829126 [Schizopora paradoxa]